MATVKRSGNKQPSEDPALKEAADSAAKQAESDAKTGNVQTSDAPPEIHHRDIRPE